ncbi:hypothetical protein [Microbulbifer sp. VAAF005]|uniref:hypothetical protein n=1 Tax=Microbulbifer sp. VAAF005 TaxID=3034230 RepID=UPI0024AD3B4F|nr:hypothetical protein [Microbulbifer sp. VAAF005]WHI46665.1 hypothetical protein P0078_23685 [Microbulbifer sp. VAAF005]
MSADAKGIALLSALIITCLCTAVPTNAQSVQATAIAPEVSEDNRAAQREKLRQARQAIKYRDRRQLRALKAELKDYPLAAYIDYWALSEKLHQLPLKEVDQFLESNRGTAIGDWMMVRLLRQLGSQKSSRLTCAITNLRNTVAPPSAAITPMPYRAETAIRQKHSS